MVTQQAEDRLQPRLSGDEVPDQAGDELRNVRPVLHADEVGALTMSLAVSSWYPQQPRQAGGRVYQGCCDAHLRALVTACAGVDFGENPRRVIEVRRIRHR